MQNINSNEDLKKATDLALTVSMIMVKNGAEIFRAEDASEKVLRAIPEITQADSYCYPTGVFVSCEYKGKDYTMFRKISLETYNMKPVEDCNTLLRDFVNTDLSLEEALNRAQEIFNRKPASRKQITIAAAFACAFFALLFGGDFRDFFAAAIAGFTVSNVIYSLSQYSLTFFIENFIGAFLSALIAVFLNKIGFGNNVDYTVIGAIMILVPGFPITNAARDIFSNQYMSGIIGVTKALFQAFSIAAGVGIVLKVVGL